MSFVFIENAGTRDERSRKLIRSHCMKGKNVGKTRMRRIDFQPTKEFQSDLGSNYFGESMHVAISPVFRDRFAGVCFPCQMDFRSQELLHQFIDRTNEIVYPTAFCLPREARNSLWFTYLLTDKAFLHCILAVSAGFHSIIGIDDTSRETLHHLTKTYGYMNESLQLDATPTDSNVATVMSMAIHENLLGRRTKMHMEALCTMVNMRGGLRAFSDNVMLLQKICRADLGHALQSGHRPRFYRDEFPRKLVTTVVKRRCLEADLDRVIASSNLASETLTSILWDITAVSLILSEGDFKVDPFVFQEIIISVLYRLLHSHQFAEYQPLERKSDSLWHQVLLAFMSTMLFQTTRSRVLEYNLLATKLHASLISESTRLLDENVMFWMSFVAGVSVLTDPEDQDQLRSHVKRLARSLGIQSWSGAEQHLRSYPWMGVFHNDLARDLWNESLNV